MAENKKVQINKVKNNLREEIKKIGSGEIEGRQLFQHSAIYSLPGGSVKNQAEKEVILSQGKDLSQLLLTTQENYEAENAKHIQRWGFGIKKENYLLISSQDLSEIVDLIQQRDQLKQAKMAQWEKYRDQKLANNPKLFFGWWMSGSWAPADHRQGLTFAEFLGSEKGKNYYLMLTKNHPALANLERKEEGQFYLIEGLENIPIELSPSRSTGENNPNNFNRWVELTDKITITPYEVESDSELSEVEKKELEQERKKECDTCHKKLGHKNGGSDNFYIIKRYHGQVKIGEPVIWACRDCYSAKEQEYLQNYGTVWERHLDKNNEVDYHQIKSSWIDCYAGKKDQNGQILPQRNCPHCQPWKSHHTPNSKINQTQIKSLIQYFKTHHIKKVKLVNGELIITHNNNETKSTQEVDNQQELQLAKDISQKASKQELTMEELEKMVNTNSNQSSTPSDNNKLWIGISIGAGIILTLGIVVWLVRKNKKVKK